MTTEAGYQPHADSIQIIPIPGINEVEEGDDLVGMVGDAIEASIGGLQAGDVLTVTHKIVSKAEGQLVDLSTVKPSSFARRFAEEWDKDARQVEVVLCEAKNIVRMQRGIIIAETHHGFICANAGVDTSNVPPDMVCLLPKNPDASAKRIHEALRTRFFGPAEEDDGFGVIITDSFGRPWRSGIVNVAIGVAGIAPLADYRGQYDANGYELRASVLAVADELAAASELVMHKLKERPIAVIRGYTPQTDDGAGLGKDLIMDPSRSLFR